MSSHRPWFVLLLLSVASSSLADISVLDTMTIVGSVIEDEDVSAIAILSPQHYILGVDEGRRLQLLEACRPGPCRAADPIALPGGDGEVDVEALARDGNALYAIGSHTCNRRRVRQRHSREKNLERLQRVTCQESREGLFRVPLDANGLPTGPIERRDLRQRIYHDPYLAAFARQPSKENGVDIEGLASAEGRLYIGFRGPVLRGNWVPVMITAFDDLSRHELRWLQLGGRGVRSLERVEGGFLLIGGAVSDAEMSYELYFWDGEDCLPDDGESACVVQGLGSLPAADGAKPEGIAVLQDRGPTNGWDIIVVYDSADKGTPKTFRVQP